jgi:anthranilate/para-aminobenzoate synthase component I
MWTPAIGEILPFLRRLLSSNRNEDNLASAPHHLPFTGGWLGWLGYDLAWEIEQLSCLNLDPLPFPVAFWYEPATFAVLDHSEQTLWLAATSEAELDQLQKRLEQSSPIPHSPFPIPHSLPPTSSPPKLTMKPLLYKQKSTSKLVIFFRRIFLSGLKSQLNLQVGRFIKRCNKLILHPLPAFGKPLGVM